MIEEVHLDFETFSELDVRKVGSFRYAEHPSTRVLMARWAHGDGPVQLWLPGMPFPARLAAAVRRGALVGAHNAHFEYAIWNIVWRARHLPTLPTLPAAQLMCTAARAAMCSLPRSLEKAGAALDLPIQKDPRGTALIKLFCSPRKPTKRDLRVRVLPEDEPAQFQEFIEYCGTDVESERALAHALPPLPPFEQRVYQFDTMVNRRGIPVDLRMIQKAGKIVQELERRAAARVSELTQGLRATQRERMLEWLQAQGVDIENLQAETVKAQIEKIEDPLVRELLELRIESSKVSTKKLISMARVAGEDGRVRGTMLYYGAHTGRWAGKLVQPHNFIRGLLKLRQQELVWRLLEIGDADLFGVLFDAPLTTIAQVMRGFIAAKQGKRLMIVDYAAIEARVLAWLAQEETMLEAYRAGVDVYRLMASFLWGIPIEQVSDEQRRLAKNLVLGCGYGLGWKQFIIYCAKYGIVIDEDMSQRAVSSYRERNPKTMRLHGDVERCAIAAVRTGKPVTLRNMRFYMSGIFLCIALPSGRSLYYPYPKITPVMKWGKPGVELSFKTEERGMWVRRGTYGGRLVENIVQAIARDIMAIGMMNAENAGYPVVLTVHDEVLSEVENGRGNVKELERQVCRLPPWTEGCPITAVGFEAQRYRKG